MSTYRRHTGRASTSQDDPSGDASALSQLLTLVPAHVFLFDSRLICRFAAPTGPAFLGRTVAQLVSAPALDVFARVGAIVPRLLQAIQTGTGWVHPMLAYPADPAGEWPAGAWQVHVQPWRDGLVGELDSEAAPDEQPQEPADAAAPANGAVVCCQPLEPEVIAASLPRSAEWHAEGRRSAQLLERIRTKLTVIGGNVELFTGRELRNGRSQPLELARIAAAVYDAERLLREYELASHLTTRHPDLP